MYFAGVNPDWIKRLAIGSALFLSLFGLVSCTRMQSAHYVGTKEPIFTALLKLDGGKQVSVWKYDDDVFYVKPVGPASAVASTLQWNAGKGTFDITSRKLVVTDLDDHLFMNIQEDGVYTILRMAFSHTSPETSLILFSVNKDKLKQDIGSGKLQVKPSADKDTYVLEGTKQELDAYVGANMTELFDFDTGGIVTMLVTPKEPLGEGMPPTETGKETAPD